LDEKVLRIEFVDERMWLLPERTWLFPDDGITGTLTGPKFISSEGMIIRLPVNEVPR
jgi:hypothetical protein